MVRFSAPFSIGSLFTIWSRSSRKEEELADNSNVLRKNIAANDSSECSGRVPNVVLRYDAEAMACAKQQFRLLLRRSINPCDYMPSTHKFVTPKSCSELEQRLKSLVMDDDQWRSKVRWPTLRICDEEDLACEEEVLHDRQLSQESRLNRLLELLILKTEDGFGRSLISQEILSLLGDLCSQFCHSNINIHVNTLKVLANIAVQDDFCAAAIANSEWISRLASMMESTSLEENLLAEKICLNALSAFDCTFPKLCTDVFQLFCPEEEPLIDIVFIHGLRGGVFRTWREKDDPLKVCPTRCWPRDWLVGDLCAPVRILAIDYASSFLRSVGSFETFTSRAQRFGSQLRAAQVGCRPVVFICHSLGGLLAKRILIDDKELRHRTVGVLFMATPHRGSPFASYARFTLRPADEVTLLRFDNAINHQLHKDFLEISDVIPVFSSVVEMRQAPIVLWQRGVIVPFESAYFERGPLFHIDDIHHNVCKPYDREDTIYKVVMQFLSDVFHHLRTTH